MNEDFKHFLEGSLRNHVLNHIPLEFYPERIFDDPLIGVAAGDDPIYETFKEVVGPEHFTPFELWRECFGSEKPLTPQDLRVVSIVFPYTRPVREAGAQTVNKPAKIYMLARNHADDLARQVLREAKDWLQNRGYAVVVPMLCPAYHMVARENPPRLYSNWSERHSAFAAGLGSFSLHEAFITRSIK
jgi:epoxyqueuosine reductase